MARYFFTISYSDRVVADREGVELEDDVDLDRCARYLAERLRAGVAVAEHQLPGCSIEVSNDRGRLLLTVPISGP